MLLNGCGKGWKKDTIAATSPYMIYTRVFRVKILKFRVGRHITKCKAVLGIIGPGSSVWVGSMDWAQGGLYFNNRRPIFPLRQEQARLVGNLYFDNSVTKWLRQRVKERYYCGNFTLYDSVTREIIYSVNFLWSRFRSCAWPYASGEESFHFGQYWR